MPSIGHIGNIINAGRDAFNNVYDIIIHFPTAFFNASSVPDHIKAVAERLVSGDYRIRTGNIKIPTVEMSKYEIGYKTEKWSVGGAKITGEKKVSFPVRIDGRWELYDALYFWHTQFGNPGDGSVGLWNAGDSWMGTIKVITPLTHSMELQIGQNFNDFSKPENYASNLACWVLSEAWLKTIEQPSFTRESDGPVSVTVTFNFGHLAFYRGVTYSEVMGTLPEDKRL